MEIREQSWINMGDSSSTGVLVMHEWNSNRACVCVNTPNLALYKPYHDFDMKKSFSRIWHHFPGWTFSNRHNDLYRLFHNKFIPVYWNVRQKVCTFEHMHTGLLTSPWISWVKWFTFHACWMIFKTIFVVIRTPPVCSTSPMSGHLFIFKSGVTLWENTFDF